MTPTREQVIQWAREAGFRTGSIDLSDGNGSQPFIEPIGVTCTVELAKALDLAFAACQQAEREKLEQVAYMTKRGAIYGGNCGGKSNGETPLYRLREEQ